MELLEGNNYPQLCSNAGLTCQVCTQATAQQLAAVCKGLKGKMIGQMFVHIYPQPACAPMHAHFAECYRRASAGESEELPVRKPAAMAAVA